METFKATAPADTIVAAIDDSRQSRRALAWAAAYARRSGAAPHAVHVLRYDSDPPESWLRAGSMSHYRLNHTVCPVVVVPPPPPQGGNDGSFVRVDDHEKIRT